LHFQKSTRQSGLFDAVPDWMVRPCWSRCTSTCKFACPPIPDIFLPSYGPRAPWAHGNKDETTSLLSKLHQVAGKHALDRDTLVEQTTSCQTRCCRDCRPSEQKQTGGAGTRHALPARSGSPTGNERDQANSAKSNGELDGVVHLSPRRGPNVVRYDERTTSGVRAGIS
jgi:hypothetical protein